MPHAIADEIVVEGPRFVMSRTPARVEVAGPTVGQHTSEILTEILGYDDERYVELVVSGALQ